MRRMNILILTEKSLSLVLGERFGLAISQAFIFVQTLTVTHYGHIV